MAQIEQEVLKLRTGENYHVDFWMSGHNHKAFVLPQESLYLVTGRGFEHVRWYILNGGSCEARTQGFGERFRPAPSDCVYATMYESGKIEANSIPILGE